MMINHVMKIRVLVKPGMKSNGNRAAVALDGDGVYVVRVKERAQEGKANDALCRVLADHFGVPPTRFAIVRGQRSRKKTVEIR